MKSITDPVDDMKQWGCFSRLKHDRCPSSNSGCPAKRQVPHGIRAKGMAAFYLIRAFLILHNGHY